jgi:hypothetical protein
MLFRYAERCVKQFCELPAPHPQQPILCPAQEVWSLTLTKAVQRPLTPSCTAISWGLSDSQSTPIPCHGLLLDVEPDSRLFGWEEPGLVPDCV